MSTIESIDLINSLPVIPDNDDRDALKAARNASLDAIIVLDDDPTGTQTVHGIPVLTEWSVESLTIEFQTGTPLFYILTNSRSLIEPQAVEMTLEIGRNILTAADATGTRFWVISRSDSTLRGHFPAEVTALEQAIGKQGSVNFIIPAFFEGGRFTINDVHYVQQGHQLIPAAETPYARDPVFGFRNSNLKKWVKEKTHSRVSEDQVQSIAIKELRSPQPTELVARLASLAPGSYCIVNAAAYADLVSFSLALLKSGIKPMLRTAASLVAALGGMKQSGLLSGTELVSGKGGLVVAGSFVSTTTAQLNHLFKHRPDLIPMELPVMKVLQQSPSELCEEYSEKIEQAIKNDQIVTLYTSRELIKDTSPEKNQEIGKKISDCLIGILQRLNTTPGFLISKGGITSSDVATKALGVRKALVKGQIIKGVPVWQTGSESKFPGLHQIIFPGNVGEESSLTEVVNLLSNSRPGNRS